MSLAETTAAARDLGVLGAAVGFLVGVVKAVTALLGWVQKSRAEAEARAKAREERAALEARRDAEAAAHRARVEAALDTHGEQLGALGEGLGEVRERVAELHGRVSAHEAHRTNGLSVVK